MRLLFILITGLPLVLASLIYLSCRDGSFVINLLVENVFDTNTLNSFNSFICTQFNFSENTISSLPSALWVFSTAVFSSRLTISKKSYWYLLFISPLVYSLGLESLQYLGITDGTFDKLDVIYSGAGWLGAVCVAKIYDLLPRSVSLNGATVVFCYCILVLGNVY